MENKGTKTLKTERLILRRFVSEDAVAMYANWASDPEVTKFLTWPPHASVDVTKSLLEDWIRRYEDLSYYNWGIELRETGDVNNPKSGRVMDKAGMKLEGIWRAAGKNNLGVCDEVWHSILKEEWK